MRTPTTPTLRRLSRGPVSVALDYDDLHMVLTCTHHDVQARVPFGEEGVSQPVVDFFREHSPCSGRAAFDIEEDG